MKIPRRTLQLDFNLVLSILSQKPDEPLEVVDGNGKVLFFIIKELKTLLTSQEIVNKQIENPVNNSEDEATREQVFKSLKTKYAPPAPNRSDLKYKVDWGA